MTEKTMESKCKEYLRIKETIKELEELANKLLKSIKEESDGKTTTFGKYYASFAEQTSVKLKYSNAKIRDMFPDVFEKLGGYETTSSVFKGIYKVK